MTEKITLAHGSGGHEASQLMKEIFMKHFTDPVLERLDDGAVLRFSEDAVCTPVSGMVVSTDSFVVTPLEFKGGDMGKLAVCGTVNDVLMMGAIPKYLSCGFILEDGLEYCLLDRIAASMAQTAAEAGVRIIAGDTKVITGSGGMYINTTGIGFPRTGCEKAEGKDGPSASGARAGDAVLLSGELGDHHACILSARMGVSNGIKSDCAVLGELVDGLYRVGVEIHSMRDVTRGGLATVLNEISLASAVCIELLEAELPVNPEVNAFCGIMGLDPLYMGNEGKLIAIVPGDEAERALAAMRHTETGRNACIVGVVKDVAESGNSFRAKGQANGVVLMKTKIGGTRRVDMMYGEGLPRIC
jgi:hydrogenase expression/formation protein HypE